MLKNQSPKGIRSTCFQLTRMAWKHNQKVIGLKRHIPSSHTKPAVPFTSATSGLLCSDCNPSCTQRPCPQVQTRPPPPLLSASPPAPASHLVVDVTICKHSVEVLDTFLSIPVIVVFQALLYCSHIHRCFNELIVILESRESERSTSPPQPGSTHQWGVALTPPPRRRLTTDTQT